MNRDILICHSISFIYVSMSTTKSNKMLAGIEYRERFFEGNIQHKIISAVINLCLGPED